MSRYRTQEVCPFNGRFAQPAAEPDYAPRTPLTDAPPLTDLLEMALDEERWDTFSRGSAIRRAGRAGFARNVCVALGNWGAPSAIPILTRALQDPEPLVREHAAWALERVGTTAGAPIPRIPSAST